jgi:hypothetical protein
MEATYKQKVMKTALVEIGMKEKSVAILSLHIERKTAIVTGK